MRLSSHFAISALAALISCLAASDSFAELYLHYNFDGNTVDSVAGRNGTLVGNAAFSSNGAHFGAGQSLSLDGSLDKVIYDTTAADNVSGTFTVAFWASPYKVFPAPTRAFFGTRGPSDTFGTDMKYVNDMIVRVEVGSGSEFLATHDSPYTFQGNEWHHVAAVVTPTRYQLYIDGQLWDTRAYSGAPILLDAGHDLAVGAVAASTEPHGEDYRGLIDDFRIFDTALSAAEIGVLAMPEASSIALAMLAGCTGIVIRRRN